MLLSIEGGKINQLVFIFEVSLVTPNASIKNDLEQDLNISNNSAKILGEATQTKVTFMQC